MAKPLLWSCMKNLTLFKCFIDRKGHNLLQALFKHDVFELILDFCRGNDGLCALYKKNYYFVAWYEVKHLFHFFILLIFDTATFKTTINYAFLVSFNIAQPLCLLRDVNQNEITSPWKTLSTISVVNRSDLIDLHLFYMIPLITPHFSHSGIRAANCTTK